jgi:chromosomal replication initiation ATPase DnaA
VRRYRRSVADRILVETAARHHISVETLVSQRRTRSIVEARHEAMFRMRLEAGLTLQKIAERVGVLDHKTVSHGLKRHRARLVGGGT